MRPAALSASNSWRQLLTGDVDQVLEIARTAPDALAVGMEAVTETLVGYVRACLANGAYGVFYGDKPVSSNGCIAMEDLPSAIGGGAPGTPGCRPNDWQTRSGARPVEDLADGATQDPRLLVP